jgi:bacterioferritin
MAGHSPSKDVIGILNEVLTGELTAINQYFIHAKMCADWGFLRLHAKLREESIDEMKHAEVLIERVLYLQGVPNIQRLGKITVGETVQEQLELDLALEKMAIPRLHKGIQICRDAVDDGSRLLLEEILASEEEHIDWIEAQLELIHQVGLQNYLAQQIHG